MTFTKSRYLSVNGAGPFSNARLLSGAWLVTAALCTSVLACSHGQPETPTEEYRRREPMWISGEVMGVDRIPVDQYNESTIRLIVTTEADENVRLELGPGWYMEENGLTFEPQQHIEFRGQPGAGGAYVAHSLRRGQKTIELRNSDGSPRWPNKTAPNAAPAPKSPPNPSLTAPPPQVP